MDRRRRVRPVRAAAVDSLTLPAGTSMVLATIATQGLGTAMEYAPVVPGSGPHLADHRDPHRA